MPFKSQAHPTDVCTGARPSAIVELTAEVEHLLSRAFIPLLSQLVETFAAGVPSGQVETLLGETGAVRESRAC